ncbi:MAG: GH25 family lysozyme [Bacillota bacterium]|nr:GH25 family lysozyme [Bacillota bacterium]
MKKRIGLLICVVCFLGAFISVPGGVKAMEADSDVIYDGIDVSQWQGYIDFAAVRDAGIEVVYIRSSVGYDYIDPYFERNYTNARNNDLRVGFYHYTTARNITEAREEARFFASVIGGKEMDCKPVMDFEYFPDLTSAEATDVAAAFMSALEDYSGKEPAIYSDGYNAANVWGEELGRYPLWIAEYDAYRPEDSSVWSYWSGWQYSDTGRISGIDGNVDLDYFTDSMFLSEENASTPSKEQERVIYYKVKSGDTLWAISRKYGTTINELVEINDISNPNLIYVGEVLKIPIVRYNYSTYIVKPGDTLWVISRRFHTTVQKLAGINDIKNPNLIYPGEIIRY